MSLLAKIKNFLKEVYSGPIREIPFPEKGCKVIIYRDDWGITGETVIIDSDKYAKYMNDEAASIIKALKEQHEVSKG